MRVFIALPLLVSAAGCNQILGTSQARHGSCDPNAPFVELAPVGGLDSALGEQSAQLSSDELTIVVSRVTVTGSSDAPIPHHGDLHVAHREHLSDDFRGTDALNAWNTNLDEIGASLSEDQHTLYFARGGPSLRYQIFAAPWSSTTALPEQSVAIALGDLGDAEVEPYITSSAIFFTARQADGSASLYTALGQRTSFAPARRLESLETPASAAAHGNPVVSSDELTIYFSAPPDNASQSDIWAASRSAIDQPFRAPHAVAELNTVSGERPAWISEDSCRLYFMTNRTGRGYGVWMASRAAP